jgi:hypothetical protein
MRGEAKNMNAEIGITGTSSAGKGFDWRVYWVLVAATVPASVALIPYSLSIVDQVGQFRPSPWVLAPVQVVGDLLFTAVAAGLGLALGPRVGLGAPELGIWLSGDRGGLRRIRSALPLAAGLGLLTGVAVTALAFLTTPLMPGPLAELAHPPAWQGFLASFGAGVREEIWLRLGLMTLLVWLGTAISRRWRPSAGIVWSSIVLATLLFGAVHLPQAAMLGQGLTAAVVATTLLLNGVAGIVFGWLYWRRGLVAAMVAHFCADVVLHVVAPMIGLVPTG